MKKTIVLVGFASVLMLSGCATMFGGGGKQKISINSDSEKRIKVTLSYADGSSPQYLTIPATVSIKRKNQNLKITSANKKFQPQTIEKDVNGWFYVNILGFPGGTLLSSTTDYSTGAMWKYEDDVTIHVNDDSKNDDSKNDLISHENEDISNDVEFKQISDD